MTDIDLSPEAASVLEHICGMPGLGHGTLISRDVRALMLKTGGDAMANGRLWDIDAKHLGAGVYKVMLKERSDGVKQAIDAARRAEHMENGRCSACSAGDRPVNGMHRSRWVCGNEESCSLCQGCLPSSEQCRACGRINMNDLDA